VELADPMAIAGLISAADRARMPYGRRGSSNVMTQRYEPGRRRMRRVCRCGTCATCADNAKWERIFREKFEDPDYYKPRPMWGRSSLG
jgi:hypothetical protein